MSSDTIYDNKFLFQNLPKNLKHFSPFSYQLTFDLSRTPSLIFYRNFICLFLFSDNLSVTSSDGHLWNSFGTHRISFSIFFILLLSSLNLQYGKKYWNATYFHLKNLKRNTIYHYMAAQHLKLHFYHQMFYIQVLYHAY